MTRMAFSDNLGRSYFKRYAYVTSSSVIPFIPQTFELSYQIKGPKKD